MESSIHQNKTLGDVRMKVKIDNQSVKKESNINVEVFMLKTVGMIVALLGVAGLIKLLLSSEASFWDLVYGEIWFYMIAVGCLTFNLLDSLKEYLIHKKLDQIEQRIVDSQIEEGESPDVLLASSNLSASGYGSTSDVTIVLHRNDEHED